MIKPLFDNILVEEIEAEKKTSSGLLLPDQVSGLTSQYKVIAVGDGKIIEGMFQNTVVKINDIVIINKFSGNEVEVDSKKYRILSEADVLAIIQ
jgi:chaperonin GroES